MEWSRLNKIEPHKAYGTKLTKAIETINAAIEALTVNRAGIDEHVAKLKSQSLETVDFDNVLSFPAELSMIVSLIQQEIGIRRELAPILSDIREAFKNAFEAAIGTKERVDKEVREALVSIGHVDAPKFERVPGKIQPGWILAHPRVCAATRSIDEMRARATDNNPHTENERLLKEAVSKLEAARDSATRGI